MPSYSSKETGTLVDRNAKIHQKKLENVEAWKNLLKINIINCDGMRNEEQGDKEHIFCQCNTAKAQKTGRKMKEREIKNIKIRLTHFKHIRY